MRKFDAECSGGARRFVVGGAGRDVIFTQWGRYILCYT